MAAATGDWRRAIELRRQTVRMTMEWKDRGLMVTEQMDLAEALHGAGERRAQAARAPRLVILSRALRKRSQ